MLASLIETFKLYNVNPEAHLTDVLPKARQQLAERLPRGTDALGLGRPTPLTVTPANKLARQPAATLRLHSSRPTLSISFAERIP